LRGITAIGTHHGAGCVGHPSAIVQLYIGAIASHYGVDLGAEATGLGQAPFSAGGPGAVVGHLAVHRLAHDRIEFESRLEGPIKEGIYK